MLTLDQAKSIAGVVANDPEASKCIDSNIDISRVLNGIDHTSVQINVQDGQQHVFDWHATLDATNPMMFESPAKWIRGEGGILLENFGGWK